MQADINEIQDEHVLKLMSQINNQLRETHGDIACRKIYKRSVNYANIKIERK